MILAWASPFKHLFKIEYTDYLPLDEVFKINIIPIPFLFTQKDNIISRTHLDRSGYKHQCHLCNGMMKKAKSKYLADVISENSDNPRRLWNSINNILHKIPLPALPEFTSVKSLCDHFSRYFVDKIETIRSKFPYKVQNIPQVQKTEIRSKMNVIQRASEDEIKKTYFELIVKIMWSGPPSYKRVKKLSWHINNSHHWHN